MRTGALDAVDADGFHTYLGRVDDMLRVGGEWVSPAEAEGVLIEHPGVLEAAIVGLPDDQNATRPVAFVTGKILRFKLRTLWHLSAVDPAT